MSEAAKRYLAQIVRNIMMSIFLVHPEPITFADLREEVRASGMIMSSDTLARELVELMKAGYLDMQSNEDDLDEEIYITLTRQGVESLDELMI